MITQLEPGLFKKVAGLTAADFALLASLGVGRCDMVITRNDAEKAFENTGRASYHK